MIFENGKLKMYKTVLPIIAFSVIAMLAIGDAVAQSSETSPAQRAAEKLLREMPLRMYEGNALDSDLRMCEEFYSIAPSEDEKRPFLLLGAQYQRIMFRKPENSLGMIAPVLMDKEKAASWKKENQDAFKAAQDQWKKDSAKAKRDKTESPVQPSGYQVELPPLREWNIDTKTAPFAVEAAACLAALDRLQTALYIIDEIGRKYSDETRVLSAECGADLFVRMKMYEKSIEFYRFALKVLDSLKKREYEAGKGERVFFSEEQKVLSHRIRSKLHLAERLYDEERYGADWVAYREARNLQREGKYLDAYFAYENILYDFQDTVYSEAAWCYQIEILCKLSDPENIEKQSTIAKQRQEELREAKRTLAMGERFREPEEFLYAYRQKVEKLENALKTFRQIPAGEEALKKAERLSEQFLEREKYGLYRGEAMLNVGLCHLEQFLNAKHGEAWLKRSDEWFSEVSKLEKRIEKFEVPDKSYRISLPPARERFTDDWNNVKLSKPGSGHLFNRRECDWYVSSKHKEAVLKLGLISYAKKEYDIAKAYWERLYEIDSYQKSLDTEESMSMVQRLLWNINHNKGALYAKPEQIAVFRDADLRFILLCADIELEIENFSKAEKQFERLLKHPKISANIEQSAYCTFALAVSKLCQFKYNESMKLLYEFTPGNKFSKTVSTPRALLFYVNNLKENESDVNFLQKQLNCYGYIVKNYPKTMEADQALFYMAQPFYFNEQFSEAISRLETYLKKYPNGQFSEIAKDLISDSKNKLGK